MHCLVYTSAAVRLMTDVELAELLEASRRRNHEDGVTGLLLYKDGNFMQALEGSRDAVVATYERIARDPRHRDIFLLLDRPIAARNFLGWSMGFRTVKAEDLAAVPGYVDLVQGTLGGPALASKPHLALKLLTRFNETTR